MATTFKRLAALALFPITFGMTVRAGDNAHFYKPPVMYGSSPACWFDEERGNSTRDWLTKFDFNVSGGETRNAWNNNGDSTNVLNIFGPTNMIYLGENVVKKGATVVNWDNFLMMNNALLGAAGTFGQLQFSGEFSSWEINLALRQNFVKGFFFEATLPVRNVKIDSISQKDLSPLTGNNGLNQSNAGWIQLKNNLDALLKDYGFDSYKTNYSKTGVGDLSIMLGWQRLFTMKCGREVGVTLKAGFLIPTGEDQKTNRVFSVPVANNEHAGFEGYGQLQFGITKWLNMRVHGSAIWFFDDRNVDRRVKTFSKQTGLLYLTKARVKEELGTQWHLGTDLTFQRFAGISARIGYSYAAQDETNVRAADSTPYGTAGAGVINTNQGLNEWSMHTMHFMVDCDCSHFAEDWRWAPRLSLFYNLPVAGKNVYKTGMVGGGLGIDIKWAC